MSRSGFLLAAGAGAGLRAGMAIGAGWLLKDAVQAVVATLDRNAASALTTLLLLFGIWVGSKLWQKCRFRKISAVPHISTTALSAAMATPEPPLLDLPGETMIAQTGTIIGARVAEHDFLHEVVGDWPQVDV